jgi:hypothetical protein
MNWYTDTCPVCCGTLHDDLEDEGWLTCFMCARSFPADDVRLVALIQAESLKVEGVPAEAPLRRAA